MGAFVLGVLVGWLIAWVYYTFWIKPNSDGDCSSIQAELDLKNKQIASLQTQISSASQSENSDSQTKQKEKQTAAAAKGSVAKTTTAKKAGSKKSTSTASKKKATANNKSTTNANKTATTTKKTKAVSKPPAKKAASAKKTTAAKRSKAGGDDFTKLSGIGPSMSAKLKSIGINSFEKLAATDDDVLRKKLEEAGARMNNNKDVMDSWNEQATLAAKGEFAELKKMQEALKK